MADKISKEELKMRANFFDLKRDEFMSLSEYLVSPQAQADLRNNALGGAIVKIKKKRKKKRLGGKITYNY